MKRHITCILLYESYGMQISDAFGSHFRGWRKTYNLKNWKPKFF